MTKRFLINNNLMQFEVYQQNLLNEYRDDIDKNSDLRERIMKFSKISTLMDAKLLSKEILPTNSEACTFYTNNAKCTIVNKTNLFSVIYDSEEEYICFRFDEEDFNG